MIINEISTISSDMIAHKKIVIYGAGTYGKVLFTYLKVKGFENNILCFAVSGKEENPKDIYETPVALFEELSINIAETIIIVAANEKNASSIFSRIENREILSCCWFSRESIVQARKEIFTVCQKFPMQKNKIFFYCYGGMGYRCNCKYIASEMLKNSYPFELVWAVSSVENSVDIPKEIKVVIIGTAEYYRELYTSFAVIENDGRDLSAYKRQGQFYINTWHGYGPFKKVNGSLPESKPQHIKEVFIYYDLFLTASRFYSQVYKDSFCYDGEIMECGAPRNDIFFADENVKENIREKIYRLYNIPLNKKIILFAPTFRYDKLRSFDKYNIDIENVVNIAGERFHKEYIVMYRFHHQLYTTEKRINYYENRIDATLYPDIQELLVTADIVITDYSSLMWDFSLQRKPVFLYQCDLEEYENERGFYAPVTEWPYPRAHSEKELLDQIKNFDSDQYVRKLNLFLEKYGACDGGHASKQIVDRIISEIEGKGN